MKTIPNLSWYSSVGAESKLPTRCPHATVESCPRYYQSLSLLGDAGSTKIPEAEDKRLLKRWKSSALWPRTREQATSWSGPEGNPSSYSNFCPEVAYERFGFFASHLSSYADAIDSEAAHDRLLREGYPQGHPKWSWKSAEPLHFKDCAMFSVLAHRPSEPLSHEHEPWWCRWWRKYLAQIVVAVVVAISTAIITKVLT